MKRIKFLNTEIDNLTMDEAIKRIDFLVQEKKPAYVVTPNLDHIVKIEEDKEFAEIYRNADLVLCDGKPLLWISKYLGEPIIEKISGSDIFPKICELANEKSYKLFFLGAAEGVGALAAEKLKNRYKNLNICGVYSPPKGFEESENELKIIKNQIVEAKPDILVVALGAPKQEKYIYHYYKELKVPVSLGLGATLDFEAGVIKRAPKILSDCGLEWLFRITQDPKRLAKRYWFDAKKIVPIIHKYKRLK